jgi:CDP-paratose 2-epimerase
MESDSDVEERVKYLVTGGLGVIGSCIARKLLSAGQDVSIIDSAEEPRNRWIEASLAIQNEVIAGEPIGGLPLVWHSRIEELAPYDGEEDNPLVRYLRHVDAVIHCAASTGIPYSVTQPSDDWERNVDATSALLEALRKHPKPTVVLSSVKPYRIPPHLDSCGGLTEEMPLEPDEPYAASKAAQSMLCMAYAKSYGLPIVTFRCSNLYGPAPCHGPRHGWLTWFCISAAIGRPIEVQGSGEQSRDMLHADDVYSACMLALNNADRLKGEVFNLGGGMFNRVTVGLAAEKLREATGAEIIRGPARKMDDDHVFVNYGKFLRATGWRPLIGVEEGTRDVLKWAMEHREDLKKLYEGV